MQFVKNFAKKLNVIFEENEIKNLLQILLENYDLSFAEKINFENTNSPLISIIMPVYNSEIYIDKTIKSILYQSYKNWELVIIDDGSIDKSGAIACEYAKKYNNIKYFYQENSGQTVARINGIKKSRGNYLMFLDSDDIFFPFSLEIIISYYFLQQEKPGLIYGDFIMYYNKKFSLNKMFFSDCKKTMLYKQLVGNVFPIGTILLRKDVYFAVGGFDAKILVGEDYDLWNRVLLNYPVKKVDFPIYIYRIHENQSIKNFKKMHKNVDIACMKLLKEVLQRGYFLDEEDLLKLLIDMIKRYEFPKNTIDYIGDLIIERSNNKDIIRKIKKIKKMIKIVPKR